LITRLSLVGPSLSRGTRTVLLALVAGFALGGGACRRADPLPPPEAAALPQISGALIVDGLSAPVTVVRDRTGIPHIAASTREDLFFAQGFVQAQDRLFQIDLWRRSVQGRLSEVLGANFIERDAATRRVQYRGDREAEWASYGPDARAIAIAFTAGINAWIGSAVDRLPQEFALAGWKPERWQPEDLLNRTDAFVASADALDEIFRAQLISALGPARTDLMFPARDGLTTAAGKGVDLAAVTTGLGDVLRRIGAPPVFSGLAAPLAGPFPPDPSAGPTGGRPPERPGSNAFAIARGRSGGSPLLAGDPHRPLTAPPLRYLVHLTAPGWNVIGATSPWLPGVAIGHNDDIAWSMTASQADVQDLVVEKLNPENPRQVQYRGGWIDMEVERDAVAVKGRSEPFDYERLYTRNGVVVGLDRDRQLAYTLRWSGTEPGGAGELASLAIDRATSWKEFRAALAQWKMPAAEFVYADRAGHIGRQLAGLVPRRSRGAGHVPGDAGSAAAAWSGWMAPEALPSTADPRDGFVVSANDSVARTNRLMDMLMRLSSVDVDVARRLQHDVGSWPAERLIPLLQPLRAESPEVEAARTDLVTFDRQIGGDYRAALYVTWEERLRRMLIERRIPAQWRSEAASRLSDLVAPLVRPTRTWFDGEVVASRNALLLEALAAAVKLLGSDREAQAWSRTHTATFVHPLAVSERARQRFNLGPFPVPGYADTVFAVTPTTGPALQVIFDLADWDRSVGVNAPGQSSAPASPHFADMARSWAASEYAPLPFTTSAVQAAAANTLILTPRQ
jgi:penicillin amidase